MMDAMSEKIIHVVTHTNWMAKELSAANDFQIRQSYGIEVPNYTAEDSWWFPQEVANRLMHAMEEYGKPLPLVISAGADWLMSVPKPYLQRTISNYLVKDLNKQEHGRLKGWWKIPEAKLDKFPAAYRDYQTLAQDIAEAGLEPETTLQFTPITLDIAAEYRFYIRRGKSVAGSIYLKITNSQAETYYDGITSPTGNYVKAREFADMVAEEVDGPPAYVLDVAWLADDSLVVLEANAVAFSAWYDSDITQVAELIWESQHSISAAEYNRWKWVPDTNYLKKVARQQKLPLA
jgi:hypothetical protein